MNLTNHIQSDCAVLKPIVDALFSHDIRVKAMRDVTRGGLGTMLNELANTSQCSIEIEEERLPYAMRCVVSVMSWDWILFIWGTKGKCWL